MCTNKEEQGNSTNSVKNSDINININKSEQLKFGASNLNKSDNRSVDFHIHTNIELIANRKIKICLLINTLITVICISASFIVCYKLYTELLYLKNEILTLNTKFENLEKSCEENNQFPNQVLNHDPHIAKAHAQHQFMDEAVKDGNYELMFSNSRNLILSRLPRGYRRNKEKHNRRNKKSSGALVAHFKGSEPEIQIKDKVLVGPWYLDNTVSKQYKFPKFHLTEGHYSIEVTEPALYLIYAQVYYLTSSAINSYTIYVRSEGSSENHIIAKCSATGPNNHLPSEISCYTATVHSLKTNDRIFIQQMEKNRTIILHDGHSFFGLVRLNNSVRNKI